MSVWRANSPPAWCTSGGKAFAAYRLAGNDFTLDIWDRQDQSLEADLARRDFTVNAFALDLSRIGW